MVNHLVTINNVIAQVEKLKAEVEKVRDRLQTEYDELPFETQDREYGAAALWSGWMPGKWN